MRSLDEITLQRLADDDLSPAQRLLAEEHLAANPNDAKRLESLCQLRALLRGAMDRAADEADLDGLWDRLRGDLRKPESPTFWVRLRLWLGDSMGAHPFRWVGVGTAAVVLAVVVTLAALPRPGTVRVSRPATEAARNQLEIEALDFKGRHPDIYQIREGERSTTVIWVHPDDEDDAPMDRPAPAGSPEDI